MASNSHTIIRSELDMMLRKLLCPKIRYFTGIFAQRHTQHFSSNLLDLLGKVTLRHVAVAGYRAGGQRVIMNLEINEISFLLSYAIEAGAAAILLLSLLLRRIKRYLRHRRR
jgi:hypothetical protein